MKTRANDLEDLYEVLKKYNPLGFRDEKGMLKIFQSYHECYLSFLEYLYSKYPSGYIDFILLMVDYFSMTMGEAKHKVKMNIVKRYLPSDTCFIEWSRTKETVSLLRNIFIVVSMETECPFNDAEFNLALSSFFAIDRTFKTNE